MTFSKLFGNRKKQPKPTTRVRPQNEGLEERTLLNATFDWAMENRFGMDRDGNIIDADNDGLMDMHRIATLDDFTETIRVQKNLDTTAEAQAVVADMDQLPVFVQDRVFSVELDAGSSTMDAPIESYEWSISGQGLPDPDADLSELGNDAEKINLKLPEGIYYVTLEITADGVTETVTDTIEVNDILIVSIGDSAASGEGNPEIERGYLDIIGQWADTEWGPADRDDITQGRLAHRSSKAYAAQAALELELADPHTSITFVSVASSGATVRNGLIPPQTWSIADGEGIPEGSATARAAQLDQVENLVGSREIDALTVSIGANDVGFINYVKDLIVLPTAPGLSPHRFGDRRRSTNGGIGQINPTQ